MIRTAIPGVLLVLVPVPRLPLIRVILIDYQVGDHDVVLVRFILKCQAGVISREYILDLLIVTTDDQFGHLTKDGGFLEKWDQVKLENKKRLANIISKNNGIDVDPESIFDCQIKRLHEYKRQLLNALHAVTLYTMLKENPNAVPAKRTIIFGGKSAPGYFMAKLIIKLINSIADVINNDKEINGMLKIVFLVNYGVSLACGKNYSSRQPLRTNFNCRNRSLRHKQYEVRIERSVDNRHTGWS